MLKTLILASVLQLAILVYNSAGENLPTPLALYVDHRNNTQQDNQRLHYFDVYKDNNCSEYIVEKEYILLENGSLVLPGDRIAHDYNTYYLLNDTAYVCIQNETDITAAPDVYNFSPEFLSCGHVLIEPHEYEMLSNSSVYISLYGTIYNTSDYYLQNHGVYVCVPQYHNMSVNMNASSTQELNKFSVHFAYVTYVGLLISVVSLTAHLIVFCLVPSVRNLPGYCLASLSLSLLAAYLCFVAVAFTEAISKQQPTSEICANVGVCVYYFFLTSFFWMNAIAFDVWRSFRVVIRELRISSHRVSWRRFLLYSLYSWLTPAILTIAVKIADMTNILPEEYKPSFGKSMCWFGQRKSLLVFFALPLIIIMLLNAYFFLDVTYVISRATMKSSQAPEDTLKKRIFMFMRLALIMGLTWIVGIIAGYADKVWLWYLFIVLNTLQGLFIFVVFSCSSKVRRLCCKSYRNDFKSRNSTSVRTISQMSGSV